MDNSDDTSGLHRRRYLSLIGAMTAGNRMMVDGARGTPTPSGDACEEVERLEAERAEKRERAEQLRQQADAIREKRLALEEELLQVRKETRDERTRFPDSIRAQAAEVGDGARESVASFGYYGSTHGWFVAENTVATSWAVADRVVSIDGELPNGRRFEWDVIEASKSVGLALLEADIAGKPLPLGDSTSLSPGDKLIHVVHHPHRGHRLVTLGEFVRRDDSYEEPFLVSDVPAPSTTFGGSPVLTMDGEVVGLSRIYGELRDDLPPFLERDIYPEPLPNALHQYHLPIESIEERLEAWT